MPIRTTFESLDDTKPVSEQLLPPGGIASFSDYSSNEQRTISVHCFEDDRGGEVFEFDNLGFEESKRQRVIDAGRFILENRVGLIYYQKSYERLVVNSARKRFHVVFQHIVVQPGSRSTEVVPLRLLIGE